MKEGESLKDFKKCFEAYTIAEFIAKKELKDIELEDTFEKEKEIEKQIEKSQRSSLEFLNDYLLEKKEKVFLFLDEVISFAEQPEKMEYLAELKNLNQIQLAIVLHRFAPFENSFRKIFEGYETHFVRQLTIEEVKKLIRTPLENTKITFADEAIQKIFEFTGGRPMEVNMVCRALMDPFSEHKNYKFAYHAEDIDNLTKKRIWGLAKSFENAIENYNRVYSRSMSDNERAIIRRLIKEDKVPISEIDPDIIQPLIDTTFVVKDEGEGVYSINGELFKRVISKFF